MDEKIKEIQLTLQNVNKASEDLINICLSMLEIIKVQQDFIKKIILT